MSLVEQVFRRDRVAQSLFLCFVDQCLSFWHFSFGHWLFFFLAIDCRYSNYGFWLPLWYLITFLTKISSVIPFILRDRRSRDRTVDGFTTTYAISAYHHWWCEFDSPSGRGVHNYVIKFVSDLRQDCGFLWVFYQLNWSPRYNWNILTVALNTITFTLGASVEFEFQNEPLVYEECHTRYFERKIKQK